MSTDPNIPTDDIDWTLTTWEGSRREQMRRWAELPLERILLALEEMQALADQLQSPPVMEPQCGEQVKEPSNRYPPGKPESEE